MKWFYDHNDPLMQPIGAECTLEELVAYSRMGLALKSRYILSG